MVNIPVGIAVTVTTRSNKAKVMLIPIRALTSELLELHGMRCDGGIFSNGYVCVYIHAVLSSIGQAESI